MVKGRSLSYDHLKDFFFFFFEEYNFQNIMMTMKF